MICFEQFCCSFKILCWMFFVNFFHFNFDIFSGNFTNFFRSIYRIDTITFFQKIFAIASRSTAKIQNIRAGRKAGKKLILYGMELNTLCIFNKFSRILIIILQCIFVLLCKFFCLLQGHSFFPPSLIFLLDSTLREIYANFLFLHSFSNFLYRCNICR